MCYAHVNVHMRVHGPHRAHVLLVEHLAQPRRERLAAQLSQPLLLTRELPLQLDARGLLAEQRVRGAPLWRRRA